EAAKEAAALVEKAKEQAAEKVEAARKRGMENEMEAVAKEAAALVDAAEKEAKTFIDARRLELVANYRQTFANPYKAAELGYIDEVIDPTDCRMRVCQSFRMLKDKKVIDPAKKHGNIPL
ncbi:MAG: methylmalonyl-CoA carboxyltransferase, partial [Candidatus Methylomirabilis sp.]|nr:methylmalonyl-CoA carboxyltransferase [Deltaproteobacteria bacterium]